MPDGEYVLVSGLTPDCPRRQERGCGAMALTGLLVLELSLYAVCFCCGIVTAASITIVQVTLTHRKKKKKKTNENLCLNLASSGYTHFSLQCVQRVKVSLDRTFFNFNSQLYVTTLF